ncbi:bifunctional hydroxymethylpyrimidine kinase/phosphomethylpyrimidine kinase [Pelomonas sp. SE-A7]|uniref:bifunctional hydroxymethylpyrimidine kinase/phosphomethylpyrimidine kinase n=1 Tax=Pelomonas sp. SE-A7 TaxID=3054953 RepID=UPI00259CB1FF|nr:bifunctional hydroxymethylpyrimidine kinase/phosphomethylpyrimidine kinase [Pelomonas sp. SE-A7]MDM4767883.1 bifunctional hydroxymethylpyrimidine kinase/phosphomethylpyrimidine kinase [Pelomonas sp. SE-A7]
MIWTRESHPPVIWSIAGSDSGGGAGLSADSRAAQAMGAHLCPVVAAVTAQNSLGVSAICPLPAAQIEAQMEALAADLWPRAIKTGLLGSAAAVECVAQLLDRMRRDDPSLALIVDPVLGASAGGLSFANAAVLRAMREQLLPRATLVTPNRREAERLLAVPHDTHTVPELAARLRATGARAVCITGGDDPSTPGGQELALDYLDSELACGWLASPRLPSPHHHGSGCSFATGAASALARGFALPDAVLLAKMLTWCAVRDGHVAGRGSGPVRARASFVLDPTAMPVMSFGPEIDPLAPARWLHVLNKPSAPTELGLYAICDTIERVAELVQAGIPQIQLRIKAPPAEAELVEQIRQALRLVEDSRSRLWINDHWRAAVQAGARHLHLGQEDWAALRPDEERWLLDSGLALGLSSHSLWELARARGLAPSYIACGPVWPTTTKDMPWEPQGTDNLAWWSQMAGRPVVAIGGVLNPSQARDCAAAGASGVALVRGLDAELSLVDSYLNAWVSGRVLARGAVRPPRPSLASETV